MNSTCTTCKNTGHRAEPDSVVVLGEDHPHLDICHPSLREKDRLQNIQQRGRRPDPVRTLAHPSGMY